MLLQQVARPTQIKTTFIVFKMIHRLADVVYTDNARATLLTALKVVKENYQLM
jgi:hypothetical protein